MALTALGLVGLETISLEGSKVGRIKDVISGPASAARYLVIRHSLFHDLVVPADAVEKQDDVVMLPFAKSVLDGAPHVGRPLSLDDRRTLEEHYYPMTKAA